VVSRGDENIDGVQQDTAESGMRLGCSIASWDSAERQLEELLALVVFG
jgi:hypothetical protein